MQSKASQLVFVYEAGPCGYALYRQLTSKGARGGSRPLRIKPSYWRSTSCLHTLVKNWPTCLNALNIAAVTPTSRRQSIFANLNAACARSRSTASRAPDPLRGMGTDCKIPTGDTWPTDSVCAGSSRFVQLDAQIRHGE